MRIACPKCSAQYEVDGRLFSDEGRAVQCAQCDTRWTQHKIEEDAPLPLQTEVDATPPAPSESLPVSERDAIRAAVEEEIAIRDGTPPRENDVAGAVAAAASAALTEKRASKNAAQAARMPEEESEDDLIKSLREQLSEAEKSYGEDETDNRQPTGRRDLSRAIDMAGIEVGDINEKPAKERKKDRAAASGQSELAAALQEYERERGPRGGARWGFVLAVFLFMVAFGIYFARGEIARAFPAAAPVLEQYAGGVDTARVWVVDMYGEVRAMISDQMGEDETPAETTISQ